nr:PAS domain S-box protein [uncultured Desulfobacter sp.]
MSRTESKRLDAQMGPDPFLSVSGIRRHVGAVYVDKVSAEPLVIMSVPIITRTGKRLGILAAEVNLKFIWQLVEALRVGETGYAYVVDKKGRLIAFGDISRVLKGETLHHLEDVSDFVRHQKTREQKKVHRFVGITGETVVGTYVPLVDPDWAVMTELPVSEAYRPVLRNGWVSVAIVLAMSALAGWMGVVLARKLSAPIVELTRAADRITAGELPLKAKIKGSAEVIRLSRAFNAMTQQLGMMLDKEAKRTRTLEMEISKRKEMESELRLTQFVYDKAPIGIWRMGKDSEILDVNEHGRSSLGYSREELCRMKVVDFDPNFDAEAWADNLTALKKTGTNTVESHHQRKNGEIFPIQVIQDRVTYGDEVYHVAFVQDITERKKAEEARRRNYSQLKAIYNTLPVIIWSTDKNGVLTLSEGKELERLGLQPGQEVGLSLFDLYKDIPLFLGHVTRALAGQYCEYVLNYKGHYYHAVFMPFFDENNRIQGINGLSINVTKQKKAEEEIRRLRNYLSNIIDSMPSVLVGVTPEGRVTQWNKQAERITGLIADQAMEKPLDTVLSHFAGKMRDIQTAIQDNRVITASKVPYKQENETRFEDITIFPLTANQVVEGAVIRVDDVTEQVRMEEMMIQSEKILSVGGLAAGMAHEINNPLAGMLQTAEVMAQRLRAGTGIPANRKAAQAAGITMESIEQYMKDRGIQRMIESITVSGQRVSEIVNNILSFARKEDAVVPAHHLADILDKTIDLAATDYNLKKEYDFKRIKITREYDETLPAVPCQATKIQQVILNILTNGAQAMQGAETPDPRFIIRTRANPVRDIVCIEIEDNGPGMDEKTRKHIFDPFFTTKPVGVGTGLGLSVSYFIITENHGGEIIVESSPGKGAKFTICLPGGGIQK